MSYSLSPQQAKAVKRTGEWFRNDSAIKQVFTLEGFAGTGKQQPLDTILQTPNGPTRMGDIEIGDSVFDAQGKAVEVVAIHPQGVQPCYRLTFRDGTSTRCGAEHLWAVFEGSAAFSRGLIKVVETSEMIATGALRACGLMRYRTPLNAAVTYRTDQAALPIKPWLLGALLGDGSMCGSVVNITVADTQPEIADRFVKELPEGVVVGHRGQGSGCYRLSTRGVDTLGNPLMRRLRELGLDVKGPVKFIPRVYLMASIDERWELLRGLMDTDGSIRSNRVSYSTSSAFLARDIAELVRSLGGVAVVRTNCRVRHGIEKIEYDVNVKTSECPFWLPSKTDKWSYSSKNPPSKYIASIERIGDCEQQCITVDSDDGLYLTDDFIVTHNSTILPDILAETGLQPHEIAFCAPTGKASKVMGEKLRAQGITRTPSTIHSLIYTPKPQKAETLERELAKPREAYVQMKSGGAGPDTITVHGVDLKEVERKIAILTKDLDRAYDVDDMRFQLNSDSILVKEMIKLIIVDEASMVGAEVAEDMMGFEIPILAMGDPGQLPPVADKPGFLVGSPDALLTEVHRQAAENPIIRIATMIRKGQRAEFGDYGGGVLIVPRSKDEFTLDVERDAQIIVGTNKTRWKVTSKIRKAAGIVSTLPVAGEPLIMCKNSRIHPNLVNGTQVWSAEDHGDFEDGSSRFVAQLREEDGARKTVFAYQGLFEEHVARVKNHSSASKQAAFRSRINDHQIDFGWAITCHKSQGSQWDEVIVHDESGSFRESADQWLYTAVTRAAERLIIVGD